MFVELHMIQSFAPANLNRDDTNNPKDCEFGGVRRARISSQCLKRAIRTAPVFSATTGVDTGMRTKRLLKQLADQLGAAGVSGEETAPILRDLVAALFSKLDKDNERSAVLLYVSPQELAAVAAALRENWGELADEKRRPAAVERLAKQMTKDFRGLTSAPDIALFGRMLAEKPELSLEAACQVAHAISTHRVTMEMDFYTAVDDLQPADTAGAGMMGFTAFNSACFYRYARIDWEQLVKNLDGDGALARQTVEGFLRAAHDALPTGKQTGFAAYNPPSLMLAVVRKNGMAWSLANAFERPVRPSGDSGLVGPSAGALDVYWERLCSTYGKDSFAAVAALALDAGLPLPNLREYASPGLEAWVGQIMAALPAAQVEKESAP